MSSAQLSSWLCAQMMNSFSCCCCLMIHVFCDSINRMVFVTLSKGVILCWKMVSADAHYSSVVRIFPSTSIFIFRLNILASMKIQIDICASFVFNCLCVLTRSLSLSLNSQCAKVVAEFKSPSTQTHTKSESQTDINMQATQAGSFRFVLHLYGNALAFPVGNFAGRFIWFVANNSALGVLLKLLLVLLLPESKPKGFIIRMLTEFSINPSLLIFVFYCQFHAKE